MYIYIYIYIAQTNQRQAPPRATSRALAPPAHLCMHTVGFHNFNFRIYNLRVSNPNKSIVDVCLTRCRICIRQPATCVCIRPGFVPARHLCMHTANIQLYNYILTIGGSLDVPVPERSDLGKKRGFFSKGERPLWYGQLLY